MQGDTNKVEVPKELVVPHKLTLTLVDLDPDSALDISGSGENFW